MTKNEAYDEFFANGDSRTMLDGLETEEDSLLNYSDNLNYKQKRYIDSLEDARKKNMAQGGFSGRTSYYEPRDTRARDERDFQRSAEIIRMLNEGASGTGNGYNSSASASNKLFFSSTKRRR